MIMEYCGECKYLEPTEAEQDAHYHKGCHYCRKYGKVIRHGKMHPLLPRLKKCAEQAEGGE